MDWKLGILKKTCNHLASCLPNTKFIETKSGGYFVNGKRQIGVVMSKKEKNSNESFKINKWKNGYGISLDSSYVGHYTKIRESVIKGLGIK